jgi:hypothetical protein
LGGLVHGFVGEGSRAGDDADAATLVDEAGHDADLALSLREKSLLGVVRGTVYTVNVRER